MSVSLYVYVWCYGELSLREGINIKSSTISYWVSLFTITGLLLTINSIHSLPKKLALQNYSIVRTRISICTKLIDDCLQIIDNDEHKLKYVCLDILRENIETHLRYCANCCTEIKKEKYNRHAGKLERQQHELYKKKRNMKTVFNDKLFMRELKTLKEFLIEEDKIENIIFKG